MWAALALFLPCFAAPADKYSYPEQKILAAGIERIQILGVKGHIQAVGRPGSVYRLKVRHTQARRFEDWSLSVDRQGGTLVLEVTSAVYGAKWRKQVQQDQWPEFDIEISGPSVPLGIGWREGKIEIVHWAADVESSHLKGPLVVRGGMGRYNLSTGEGGLLVEGLSGELRVGGQSGAVDIQDVTGPVKLSWIRGQIRLERVQGGGQVELNEGRLHVDTCRGRWTMKVLRGSAQVTRCAGQLLAEGDSTSWRVSSARDLETEIKSLSGSVDMDWNTSGAKVFLTSDSGPIQGPRVRSRLDDRGRWVAELKVGQKPYSSVFIKTQSGAISFR